MERESMQFDVVIVGGGPAGLAAACRLGQLARQSQQEITVCLLEKGAEIGAHILSGAVFDPRALQELFPDYKEREAPLKTAVSCEHLYYLTGAQRSVSIPSFFTPHTLNNEGHYVISLADLCRWLATQAQALGVEIFPGFGAHSLIVEQDEVKGVITGDMGVDAAGKNKGNHTPGMELRGKYTLLAEGSRGHLGKEVIARFGLDHGRDPQHYGIGIKELWEVPARQHQPGVVVHSTGWPLSESGSSGGGFLYHLQNNQVAVGLITDLNYSNPHLSPFDEFQRLKHHPRFSAHLAGGKRLAYGARALTKGGPQSLPEMAFAGGFLLGCNAGTLNSARIKGSHTAIKSGMLAAESLFPTLTGDRNHATLASEHGARFKDSWLYRELYQQRNFSALVHRFGGALGGALAWCELNIARGKGPWTLHERRPDYACLKKASESVPIAYGKPDGILSFDKASSVYLSNTNHEEDQPCHLKLADDTIPLQKNWPMYDEPAQRYCPAGVYEVVDGPDGRTFRINAQNCVHCKTCDIKDPAQNISWMPPEGGGGPHYPNM